LTKQGFEWLPISAPKPQPKTTFVPDALTLACPACGWPNVEDATTCTRCGATFELQPPDVTLPPHDIVLTGDIVAWMRSTERDSLGVWRLRRQASQAQLATGFDQLICLDDIYIDQYPHQLDAALTVLRDMRGRALLADEVGLGKTIEAGIVMKELIVRGLVRSVLILTPASLALQWQEEMQTKFVEPFQVLTRKAQIDNHDQGIPLRWICSLERGKRKDWAEELLAREYDLLIVDEAHKLKNRRTQAFRFVNQVRKRYVLLLTATPVQNDLVELHSLITILRPGHLGTAREFRKSFLYSGRHRRVFVWSSWGLGYRGALRSPAKNRAWVRRWQVRDPSALPIERLAQQLPQPSDGKQYSSVYLKGLETARQVLDEAHRLTLSGYQVSDAYLVRHRDGRIRAFRLDLARSEPVDRTNPRNPASLRRLLSEVMIRNRRSHAGVFLPRRRAGVYTLDLTPPERALYDGVTAYIRQQIQQAEKIGPLRMTLMTLQREVCSSPAAVAATLYKMVTERKALYASSRDQLVELLDLAQSVHACRKARAVLDIALQFQGKLLVFTDYRATMEYLYETLSKAGVETVCFYGGLSAHDKEKAVRAFRQGAQVMLSTESGAEGRNLQFCHQMVNYDLPWNPMRIEQRIGRIHRLGQTREVIIFNLAGRDTIEDYILNLLARKIRMFELVVGELDLVLGNVDSKRSFEALLRDAWINSSSDQELVRQIAALEALIDDARRTFDQIHQTSDSLSDLLDAREEVWKYGLDLAPHLGDS
jgi:superfamily II DNA or RNA helicase